MRAIGIDIGTTTISVIMLNGDDGSLIGSRTIAHQAFLPGRLPVNKIQDPEKLYNLTENALYELTASYGKPDCIGLTGQMHGVLYTDQKGQAVSPLYTWQDGSGNEKAEGDTTYAQLLRKNVGAAASGYGLTTHFYLCKNGLVPENASEMTTISDYIAMRLCGRTEPVLAQDMAASWGCFDMEKGEFLKEELKSFGVRTDCIPKVLKSHEIIGETTLKDLEGIPVMASLGDNQASVIGSVQDLLDTVLVNIGTGSQVSTGIEGYYRTEGSIELRPLTGNTYLLAGSGLCGGRAYAMLENFFRQITEWAEESGHSSGLYDIMEKQAREFLNEKGTQNTWKIRTTFAGTRTDPKERGAISGIGIENFTPGAMTAGMLFGILEELHEMFEKMCEITGKRPARLVGSGNGIRRNSLMQELAQQVFGMDMKIPRCEEEAAYGAALHAFVSAGFCDSLESVQKIIQYI